MPPRFIKLPEFAGHSGNVNCIKIGRNSCGVMVTGGDDKKVNLWTIGTQTRTLSLTGHTSPVDSVTFDRSEEVVAAGAASGSIKVYDLDQAKVTKSLPGHKSNVLSLEFAPFDGSLVSGGMDTNVKVWDLRRKDAITTCKGHKSGVTHVRYSPDGRWIASASDDGDVKVWDIASGKVLMESSHTHPITGLEFNPNECLLASCSADKVVKVWDLEAMRLLESTPPEATGVRAISWHYDGRHLFSALQDGLRVWSIEPATMMDNVDIPWSKIADVTAMREKNRIIGASFYQSMIGLWVVELKDLKPFGGEGAGAAAVRNSSPYKPSHVVHSVSPSHVAPPRQSSGAADLSRNMQGLELQGASGARAAVPAGEPSRPSRPPISHSSSQNERHSSAAPAVQVPPALPRASSGDRLSAAPPSKGMVSVGVGVGDSLFRGPDPPPAHPSSSGRAVQPSVSPSRALYAAAADPPNPSGYSKYSDSDGQGRVQRSVADVGTSAAAPPSTRQSNSMLSPPRAARSYSREPHAPLPASSSSSPADLDVIQEVISRHDDVRGSCTSRLSNLQIAKQLLLKGDIRGVLNVARRHPGDPQLSADILRGLHLRREAFSLDLVPDAVALIELALALPHETQLELGVEVALNLYRAYAPVIKDTLSPSAARANGVDLSYEQRRDRCSLAKLSLQNLSTKVAYACKHSSRVAAKAGNLAGQLANI